MEQCVDRVRNESILWPGDERGQLIRASATIGTQAGRRKDSAGERNFGYAIEHIGSVRGSKNVAQGEAEKSVARTAFEG